jgi:hypothetical protein
MKTYSKIKVNRHKRVSFSREIDPGARAAVGGQLTPNDVLGTFDYTLIPGLLTPTNIAKLSEELFEFKKQASGLWLIREGDYLNTDELGWVCIHWPSYLKRVVWHNDTFAYLRNKGCSVRGLQKMSLQDFEGATETLESYKAVLSRALPPGCLLEADNPFFNRLVGMLVQPEHYGFFTENALRTSLGPWSFFRFGALAERLNNHGAVGRFSHLLERYSPLKDLLIGKAIKNAPEGTPTLVLTLLHALENARHCGGAAWQKWGIAWIKDGLAFNYRQAIRTISLDDLLYRKLFGSPHADPAAEWLDPAYLLQRAPGILPRLGAISRTDPHGRAEVRKATDAYESLFQDTDPDVQARQSDHSTDFQIFFPINAHKASGTKDIISYIEHLTNYNDVYAAPIHLNTHAVKAKEKLAADKPKPAKIPDRAVYVVGFNGYNLGCSLPQPTDLPVYPFNMCMVEYKGENYFSFPENLIEAYPELIDVNFYNKDIPSATLIWRPGKEVAWDPFVYAQGPKSINAYAGAHFAEIELAHLDIKRKPLYCNYNKVRYFHNSVFRKDGEVDTVISAILEHRPESNPDHVNLLTTFQTLWHWVYDVRRVIAQGKVSEEFMYNVGLDTKHCPEKRRLATPNRRLQYIIDKAIHSRDARVCDLAPSHDRSAPRSKQLNSYDDFALWYSANHEIAELPWKLDEVQQATYVCKRWLPWRRPPGLITHLVKPHKQGTQAFASNQMPQLLAYAQKTFGPAFTEY